MIIVGYGSIDLRRVYSGLSQSAANCLFNRLDMLTESPLEYVRDHEEFLHGFLHALYLEGYFLTEQYEELIDLVGDLASETDQKLRNDMFRNFMQRTLKGA